MGIFIRSSIRLLSRGQLKERRPTNFRSENIYRVEWYRKEEIVIHSFSCRSDKQKKNVRMVIETRWNRIKKTEKETSRSACR